MGVYSNSLTTEVRLERMRPDEIERAKAQQPAIYVPFGSIEWHGRQNPVGLDAIKAHEQLVGLAERAGGVVYPAVFFGSGGGHGAYRNSFMVSAEPMGQIVTDLLKGFERDGYRKAVLVSGHYPNRGEFLDRAIESYKAAGGKMSILAIVECEAPGVGGDHAAYYETSAMLYLHPETVSMRVLGACPEQEESDKPQNWMDDSCRGHACYGILGVDPRGHATAAAGKVQTGRLIAFLEQWVRDPVDTVQRADGWLLPPVV